MTMALAHVTGQSARYFSGYETEPCGGGNPYYRCIHCKQTDPQINGALDGHLAGCTYRRAMEEGQEYKPFAQEASTQDPF